MCITAYFIDDEWKLHKRIISFIPMSSHKGEYITKALENCLLEWGLKNAFTVTVDNTSSNDITMSYFKKKLLSQGTSIVKAKYVYVMYFSYILNLIVQDELKEVSNLVKKVRETVKQNSLSYADFIE